MSSSKATQARRKNLKRAPGYYKRVRQEHKTKVRTAPPEAPNTSKSKALLLKKWTRSVTLHSFHLRIIEKLMPFEQVLLYYR